MISCLVLLACCAPWAGAAPLHHDLEVVIDPGNNHLEVRDTISLPADNPGFVSFALHPQLKPRLPDADGELSEIPDNADARMPLLDAQPDTAELRPKRYRVRLPAGQNRFTLHYSGRIAHALQQQGEEYARSFQQTLGVIGAEGVFLAGASFWYPHFDSELMTFDLRVQLPPDWKSMSQGESLSTGTGVDAAWQHWRCDQPQEEIYLIAAAFTEYQKTAEGVLAQVLLRQPDAALAQRYLDATHPYIALYNKLIGRYPFGKFALVENFWESGYGMPSFTLLGSQVIRLPFILHSSYPHEILHNWWGNGVYVDYASGNWAEGLTSYLADHLVKEQRGEGVDYRRNVLQKYTDYVNAGADFPLTGFRGRHSARSESIGYGKTLMLFHMLRRQLGDALFIQGLQTFYQQYRFQVADFDALQQVFSTVAQQPLQDFFAQWVERSGAPQLQVSDARVSALKNGYRLSATVEQVQPGTPYILQIPLAVQLEGVADAYQTGLQVSGRRQRLQLDLPARPLRLDVDPEFDLFRRLHRNELPPAVSQALGAERVLLVLPAQAPRALQQAYRALAESWRGNQPEQVTIALDNTLEQLPGDRTVWLFGWQNRFRPRLQQALQAYDFTDDGDRIRITGTTLTPDRHSLVVLGRLPDHPEQALGWLASDDPAALPGLGRKLPHYGRYSYLAFTGSVPDNMLKGQWPVVDSPLSLRIAESDVESGPLRMAPRPALVMPTEPFSSARMQADIAALAADSMAGRGLGTPELAGAADYLAQQFATAGLQPGGELGGWFQTWQEPVDGYATPPTLQNVVGILPGTDPTLAASSLVIGAHYDHLGRGEKLGGVADRGRIHPGADDNASGLAVLLEMARALQGKALPRSLVFVAFSGEESGRLGSRHYVQQARDYPVEQCIAMLNLDSVGRLGDRSLVLFGTGSAEEWAHIFRGAGYMAGVPVQAVAEDFGSSDHSSFIEAGIPAVQFFSGNHADMHRPGDTADKIDSAGLIGVAKVLHETVQYLAARREPLRSTLNTGNRSPAAPPAARRASLGTVPDFTWSGDGVRLEDVRADTPAARAGLRKGDIIIVVNDTPVRDMRDYGQALRELDPGEEISLRFQRNGMEQTITTRVTER